MLAYAFQVLNEQGYKNIATEEFDNTAELCAAILARGISTQVKRGLGKEYIPQTEALSSLRGKLDISESMYVCEDPLYLHRKRHGSITETCSQKNISDWFLAYSYFDDFVLENTPSVFTGKMLEDSRRQRMHTMVRFYGLYSGDQLYKEYLRGKVIESIDELGIPDHRIITRIGLYMIYFCPRLFRLTYSIYYCIRKMIRLSTMPSVSLLISVRHKSFCGRIKLQK